MSLEEMVILVDMEKKFTFEGFDDIEVVVHNTKDEKSAIEQLRRFLEYLQKRSR